VDPKELGRRIMEARKGMGWSQRELARRSETIQATISLLENGKRKNVRLGTLLRILASLGLRYEIVKRDDGLQKVPTEG